MIDFSFFVLYFLRIKKIKCHSVFGVVLVLFFAFGAQAATYNLTSGQYPPCNTSWSVSGTSYTCTGNGRVTLASGDILTSNATINIVANNGFSLTTNTIGTSTNSINLTSSSGTVVSAGTNTLYGFIQNGSGNITLVNSTVSGAITTGGDINLTGGSVAGLVTSSSNTITTNNTNLTGGAKAQSGMSITGGSLAGAFTMTSANAATFSNVVMASGSISGASTVSITGSTLGSSSASISITSTSGAVSLSSSTVYGALTAPNYSTINVPSGSAVYGTCSPNSTPANACNTSPPTCTTGFIGGITGSYFNNKTLTAPAAGTRVDTSINFDWTTGAPGVTGIGVDNFSVRWSGSLRAPVTGSYVFQTISDDGVRLWVNGQQIINNWTDHSVTTNNSSSIVLTSGQSYTVVMEFYENGGSAVAKLNWLVPGYGTYSAISTQTASNPNTGASCPISSGCSGGGLLGGASGKYYNNTNLTGTAVTRIDTTIDFNWDTGSPGVTGIGADNFSVRWDGYIKVPTTGNYQFETVSDDGVRLTINNQLVIDNWTSHSQTSDTTGNIALTAGTSYPVRVDYFEAGGVSTIALHWKTPSDTNFVSIPTCPSAVAYYGISHSGAGITCAGEPITFTAYDNLGSPVAPTVGSQITLSTTPNTGVWAGGNTYVFSGGETNIIKYLQQTTAATLNINVSDGTYSESSGIDPSINFVTSALKFYNNTSTVGLQNQVAGTANSTALLKALRTDNNTGACIAQVTGTKAVKLGYQCVNPTSCVVGQTFSVNGSNIAANAGVVTVPSIAYTTLNLTFDSSGAAPIALNYSDVGRLTLYAQMTLPASGNDPAITWSDSNSFVVKPYTLSIPSTNDSFNGIQTTGGVNNPGATSASASVQPSALFVSAGTPFRVKVQSLNANGAVTPNFGNETTSEKDNMQVKAISLVYPSGGGVPLPALTGAGPSSFTTATTPAGTWINNAVVWNQVGSITLRPELSDSDYLTAGDVFVTPNVTGTVGRFYPDHFSLVNGTTGYTCGAFSYLGQPNIKLNYQLQARDAAENVLTNYGTQYSPSLVTPVDVAENADGANGGSFAGRLIEGATLTGAIGGTITLASTIANVDRLSPSFAPEGPYANLQWGLNITDNFDGRGLGGKNMNALASGVCSGAGCTAATVGNALDLRYGRLRLDDAFGPETVALPVNFYTEYWTGNHFTLNAQDSCTLVTRAAITYPAGVLSTDANRTVALTGGSTQGTYNNLGPTGVLFNAGVAGQVFTAPTASAQGKFIVSVDLTSLPWLRFDWNQDGNYSDLKLPNANFEFGSYRGNDRVIYWREKLQ